MEPVQNDLAAPQSKVRINNEKTEYPGIVEHTLRGEIRHIVYSTEDESYTVFRIVDAQGVEHTVVGPVSGAYEGQGIEVAGVWERHKEHGRQFRANSYKYILPSTPDGIKRYLASGLIYGIGTKLAQCIVEKFGTKTLEILDNYSSRLTEIPGFGKKRLEMVRKAWREHAEKRDIFIFLQGLGISLAYCQRIYRVYADKSPGVVKENPYRLAEEVDGIGFIMADRIAFNLGIRGNDDKRLAAGISYSLNRLSQAGHVCYPETEFLKYASDLLKVEIAESARGLQIAEKNGLVVTDLSRDDSGISAGQRMVYDKSLFSTEQELSRHIRRLTGVSNHHGRKILKAVYSTNIPLNAEQLEAVNNAVFWPVSIITGGPGVGKTTVVGELVKRARSVGLKVYLAAPTGRAAKRLSESCRYTAMTIHRLLKWEPAKKNFTYNSKHPLPCDMLVIDETSMLDLPLALYLFRAIASGTTVVMVGDADQLPSVGPGTFLMDMILSNKCKVTHLSQIYRQDAGSLIITNAYAVNAGRMPNISPVPRDQTSDFYWIEQDDPEHVVKTVMKMVRERIPERFGFNPIRDIQVLSPMNRGTCGTITLNELLQSKINPEGHRRPQFNYGERVFRTGDRVMQVVNNYDKGVFNGEMGYIINIDSKNKRFRVAYDTGNIDYDFIEADQLTLAYAITVHKSQGSEFPAIIIPLLTQHYVMLQRNLLYTAMTRAKKLLIIIGSRKALSIAVNNAHIEPRYSMFLQRLKST